MTLGVRGILRSFIFIMLSVDWLNVFTQDVYYATSHNAQCLYAECHYAEGYYAKSHNAQHRYVKCCYAVNYHAKCHNAQGLYAECHYAE